jgi:DNA-binding transcriptional LysR family regulator
MDRLSSMETFVAAVEAGSLSAAARQLNVGQPAVSKSITQLEERLGVRLLLRSARGLTPTEAGANYYENARRAMEEASRADHSARGEGASLTGRLRFSAATTFARLHIVPRLPEFLAAHPELSVDVVLDDRDINLLEEGIDVALRMGTLIDSAMTARRIAQSPRIAVATPAYLAVAGEPRLPRDLRAHQVVAFSPRGGDMAWPFRRGEEEVVIKVKGRLQPTAAEGVRAAVLADVGIAIGSTWMFTPELLSGQVRHVLADWTLPPVDLWALYPGGRLASPKARALIAFVGSILEQTRALEPA